MNENLSEHSLEVAVITHALAVIRNKRFGGNINPERAALIGLLHDSSEIITGDLPTPIKYFNLSIKNEYKKIETDASLRLLNMLPEDLRDEYTSLLIKENEDSELWKLCKAADKLSALIKCIEERKAGNLEFKEAEASTLKIIRSLDVPEANVFLEEFIPSFELTIDELNKEEN